MPYFPNFHQELLQNGRVLLKLLCIISKYKMSTSQRPTKLSLFRRNHRTCSIKKMFLKMSQSSQEKHLCQNLFLVKLKAFNFIKKKLQHNYFPVNFAKFLRTTFLHNTLGDCSCLLELQSFIGKIKCFIQDISIKNEQILKNVRLCLQLLRDSFNSLMSGGNKKVTQT